MVIGGGVGGLYTAWRLAREFPGASVTVLESRAHVGGRQRTTRDSDGNVIADTGAWRVHPGHKKTRDLLRELGHRLLLWPLSESGTLRRYHRL